MVIMSGRDERPEYRYTENDMKCPRCGEIQWVRCFIQRGVAYYDESWDIIDYSESPNSEVVWEDETWKCDSCDSLAPTHIRMYLNDL